MPTYTYKCTKCEHAFEKVQKMSDPPAKRCPECRSKVQRTFHPVGIVLKGSGFHKNDYRSKPSKSSEAETDRKTDTAGADKSSDNKSSDSKSSDNKSSDNKSSDNKSSDKKDSGKKDAPKKTEAAAKS